MSKHGDIHIFIAFMTYFSYALLVLVGHIRDFCAKMFGNTRYISLAKEVPGIVPIMRSSDSLFTRRLFHRIQDCWARPIASAAGAHIKVMNRSSPDGNITFHMDDTVTDCINVGSYNYLGFADDWENTCGSYVLSELDSTAISCCTTRNDFGTTADHLELEQVVARFVGGEAAAVFTMGYGTNAWTIPCLAGRGDLIVSDELNHVSIVSGSRASGAAIRTFKHNDAKNLEKILKEAIVNGRPRLHQPWRRILVIIEGIYSMEGEFCDLKPLVAVCKKYKAFVYLDEAHSIGAVGKTGRGVCEFAGVDPKDVDVLMGTFTKSFAGMGGYVCGSRDLIGHIKSTCAGFLYANSLSPLVARQVITAMRIVMGEDGTNIGRNKLNSLRENSNYMRSQLEKNGFALLGHYDSPVIPLMVYLPCKVACLSRMALSKGLAMVMVGFPATNLILARSRICVSAAHTREDLDKALAILAELGDVTLVRYNKRTIG